MPDEEKVAEAAVKEPPKEVIADVREAADAVGGAAETATNAGENATAQALAALEERVRAVEGMVGGLSVTKASEVAAKPVAPAEETVEAVVPEVVVTPRKKHWTSRLPRFL